MKNIIHFEDILIEKYGSKGTEKRDKYDSDSLTFGIRMNQKQVSIPIDTIPELNKNTKQSINPKG